MPSLQLFLTNINNSFKLTVNCESGITVLDLKEIVAKELNSYPCLFRLVHKGSELISNEQFLIDVPVKNGNVLYVMMKINMEKEVLMEFYRRCNGVEWGGGQKVNILIVLLL